MLGEMNVWKKPLMNYIEIAGWITGYPKYPRGTSPIRHQHSPRHGTYLREVKGDWSTNAIS